MEIDYETLTKNFNELSDQISVLKSKMSDQSKVIIERGAKEIFENYPFVHDIFWTQYTPYFNDGESCEFSVNEIGFTLNSDIDEDGDYSDEYCDYEGSAIYTSENLKSAKKAYAAAKLYEEDPEAWRQSYMDEYKIRHGREYSSYYGENNLKPYPSSTVDAQKSIDKIESFLSSYDVKELDSFKKSFGDFCKIIGKVENDVMEMVFGDHVKVIISRDGIDIDEYQHD